MKKFNNDFFKVIPTPFKPAVGRILISVPFYSDSFFYRTVVVLTDYDKSSCVGLVINKVSHFSVKDIVSKLNIEDPIYVGGPVSHSLAFALHNYPHFERRHKLMEGVYIGYDENLLSYMESKRVLGLKFKFFVGYSGWYPKQLENEIERNLWVVSTADPELILDTPTELIWTKAVEKLGENYSHWLQLPYDPTYN